MVTLPLGGWRATRQRCSMISSVIRDRRDSCYCTGLNRPVPDLSLCGGLPNTARWQCDWSTEIGPYAVVRGLQSKSRWSPTQAGWRCCCDWRESHRVLERVPKAERGQNPT
jgi:hypothetical protein